MENLPYFLSLIKKNIILYSIISSNSFNNVDLKKYETVIWSDRVIEIKNFKLDNDHAFNSIMIAISDLGLSIKFSTSSSKYFDNPKEYFKRDSPVRSKNYEIFAKTIDSNSKRLGEFDYFKPPVDVTLYKSNAYGYTINLLFLDKEALTKIPDE